MDPIQKLILRGIYLLVIAKYHPFAQITNGGAAFEFMSEAKKVLED